MGSSTPLSAICITRGSGKYAGRYSHAAKGTSALCESTGRTQIPNGEAVVCLADHLSQSNVRLVASP